MWGRGGHAKDVRGLVMELNAVAGRGEDPQNVLRRSLGLGRPGSQQPQPLQARDHRCPSGGDDGRDFSLDAPRLRFAEGAEELRPMMGQAGRARSGGFALAGLASDGGRGDATAVDSWGSVADGTACPENAQAGGVGFEAYREHTGTRHASTWQQAPVQPTGSGGRGGSRWGVFASDRASQGLVRRQGQDQQACVDTFYRVP